MAGVALDALLGDPRRGHPVAAFGRAAQVLQDRMYADSVPRGAWYAACCILAAAAPGVLAMHLTRRRPWLRFAAAAAAAWTVTGGASLASEAGRIRQALAAGDLDAARAALPSLCGRDPDGLDEQDLVRAVIESVAENASDAVVAPLLWGLMGAVPGMLAYRAINTLDSMVGYRSARYAKFGWASARLDDVVNWAPARVTGLMAGLLAPAVGGRPAVSWRAMRRYGARHPSPNAGRCEAAFAGALGVRLGGTSCYGGVAEERPHLGDGRAPQPGDIASAVRLCRAVTAATATGAAAAALMMGRAKHADDDAARGLLGRYALLSAARAYHRFAGQMLRATGRASKGAAR
jgi:adenosylcobinamide-phosphate synthase